MEMKMGRDRNITTSSSESIPIIPITLNYFLDLTTVAVQLQ